MKKLVIVIVIAVFLVAAAGVFGFLLGKDSEVDSGEVHTEVVLAEVVYAEILSIDNGLFHVKGLDVNDINGRGEYVFSAKEDTKLIWRGTELSLRDFDAGDRIAFYYNGYVLTTHPARVQNVVKIKLLDDEV